MGHHGLIGADQSASMRFIGVRIIVAGLLVGVGAMTSGRVLGGTVGASETANSPAEPQAGKIKSGSNGLHGYIGFNASRPPAGSEYTAGMSFYSAVWPLIDKPLANFQIGLASTWITPDNSDDKDKPLAPEGT